MQYFRFTLLYHRSMPCSVPLQVFRLPPSSDEEFGEEQPSVKFIQSAHTHGPARGICTERHTSQSQSVGNIVLASVSLLTQCFPDAFTQINSTFSYTPVSHWLLQLIVMQFLIDQQF